MREVELLAPAGDLEKLKIAFIYGADAVYIGGEIFGMRSAAKNFSCLLYTSYFKAKGVASKIKGSTLKQRVLHLRQKGLL